jgi:hypothetical protein
MEACFSDLRDGARAVHMTHIGKGYDTLTRRLQYAPH